MEEKVEYLKRDNERCHYDKRFILDVVKLVEQGVPRKEVNSRFGLGASSLDSWMLAHGSKDYQERKRKNITALERRRIIAEVDQGRMTVQEAQKKYHIKSVRTINAWLYKWRLENRKFYPPIEQCMTKKKRKDTSISTTGQSVEKALEDAQLKIEALNTMIDIAEERLKIDIRKKPGTKQ